MSAQASSTSLGAGLSDQQQLESSGGAEPGLTNTSIGQQDLPSRPGSPPATAHGQLPSGEMTQDRSGLDSGDDESERGPSGEPRGTIKVIRSIKACDVCKIRKVKCDGGDPCLSCRLHNCPCLYSKVTRKKLISMQNEQGSRESGASSGTADRLSRALPSASRAAVSSSPVQRGAHGESGSAPMIEAPAYSSGYTSSSIPSARYLPPDTTKPSDGAGSYPFSRNAFDNVHSRLERPPGHILAPHETHAYPIRSDGSYGALNINEFTSRQERSSRHWGQQASAQGQDRALPRPDYFSLSGPASGPNRKDSEGYPFTLPPLSQLGQPAIHGDLPSPRERLLLPPPTSFPAGPRHHHRASADGSQQFRAFQQGSGLDDFPSSHFGGSSSSSGGGSVGGFPTSPRGSHLRRASESVGSSVAGFMPSQRATGSSGRQEEQSRPSTGGHRNERNITGKRALEIESRPPVSRRLNSEPGAATEEYDSFHDVGRRTLEEIAKGPAAQNAQPAIGFSRHGDLHQPRPTKRRKFSAPDDKLSAELPPPRLLRVLRTHNSLEGKGVGSNNSITTLQADQGMDGVKWWGAGSFMDLQDQVVRLIRKRKGRIGSEGSQAVSRRGSAASSQSESEDLEYYLSRWGVEALVYEAYNGFSAQSEPSLDLMFLPSSHAYRFFHSYSMSVHPITPILDLDEVRIRIQNAYAGDSEGPEKDPVVSYQPLSQDAKSMALDLLVLALGAGTEAGDGDAFLPKQTAVRWSRLLSGKSKGLITSKDLQGGISAIKVWLLHSILASIAGNVHQQYMALGIASRMVSGLGLHREAVCSLPGGDEAGLRVLFFVTLFNERITALWQGRPSCMTEVYDTLLPEPTNIRIQGLHANIELSNIAQKVHNLYHSGDVSETAGSRIRFANSINADLDRFRTSVAIPLRNFDSRQSAQPIALDTLEGEMSLLKCVICLLFHYLKCMTNFPVWQLQNEGGLPAELKDEARSAAELCAQSAMAGLILYDSYCQLLPYLCFMGNLSLFVLKSVQVIYACVVQDSDQPELLGKYLPVIRTTLKCLERVDHPASLVARNMLQDCLYEYFPRTAASSQGSQVEASAV